MEKTRLPLRPWHPLYDFDSWPPNAESSFFEPANDGEATEVRAWAHGLSDGALFPVRGRDLLNPETLESELGPWEYGIALKYKRRLLLLWPTAVESCLIDGVNFVAQLHVTLLQPPVITGEAIPCAEINLLALAHGFSPEDGPHYALCSALQDLVRAVGGWTLVVPDFRPSYAFGPARGRSERVRLLQEEILLTLVGHSAAGFPRPARVVLVGHSQGGAAAAQLCSRYSFS